MRIEDSIKTAAMLISILETRDPNLTGHSIHIEKLCSLIYDFLPFSMKLKVRRQNLIYAALFHDIGQVGVSNNTLGKAGKLTENELTSIRRHPEISVEILKEVGCCPRILNGVLYHHERMDGKGYYGLDGSKIPLISRILAIADTFSAVTVSKSYKPSRTYEDGITTLRLGAGTQFDPELIEIFCKIPMRRVMGCAEDVQNEVGELMNHIQIS